MPVSRGNVPGGLDRRLRFAQCLLNFLAVWWD